MWEFDWRYNLPMRLFALFAVVFLFLAMLAL